MISTLMAAGGAAMSNSSGLGFLGVGIGAGLVIIGAAAGIGKLAAACLEGTARQPEASGDLRTSMIIPAALIEGIALFALIICFLTGDNTLKHSEKEAKAVSSHVEAQP